MIRKLLKEKKISQARLIKEVGICIRSLHNYMNGTREMPVSTAKKIAKVLEVDWWKLYDD